MDNNYKSTECTVTDGGSTSPATPSNQWWCRRCASLLRAMWCLEVPEGRSWARERASSRPESNGASRRRRIPGRLVRACTCTQLHQTRTPVSKGSRGKEKSGTDLASGLAKLEGIHLGRDLSSTVATNWQWKAERRARRELGSTAVGLVVAAIVVVVLVLVGVVVVAAAALVHVGTRPCRIPSPRSFRWTLNPHHSRRWES